MIINAANVLDATLCRGEFRGCQVRFEILSIYNSLKIGFEPAKYMLFYHQSINQISDLHSALSSLCNILTCYCFYIIIEATFQNFSRLYNLYLPKYPDIRVSFVVIFVFTCYMCCPNYMLFISENVKLTWCFYFERWMYMLQGIVLACTVSFVFLQMLQHV